MLRDLRKVGGVYLLSNAQSCFTVDELKTCGLYDLFDGIIISSDVGTKKPWGEIFNIAFDRFGITPENSIYVGNDMRDDILGASSKGMRTLYIETTQSGSYPHLDLPKPTFVVKNHAEMKERLISLST
jgi:putative hydrolase of the HAD superfamily